MTTAKKMVLKIVDGPSREEMFDSLRLLREGRNVKFEFQAFEGESSIELTVRMSSIQGEDGSGQSWCIGIHDDEARLGRSYIEGYYRTDSRKGFLNLSSFAEAEMRSSSVLASAFPAS